MARSKFFTVEKLGPKQSLTPEKFLIIEDVPIARIGVQEYHTEEVNLPGDANGIVRVRRDEKEVFSDQHIASYNGKAIVDDHPNGVDVNPENFKTLTVGTVMNAHRGTGADSDLLFADFIICDRDAIEAVRSGKRQVSCGYDADYNEISPGEGEQVNLKGNHVALVDAGRCGVQCSIQDQRHPLTGDREMKTRFADKHPWLDRLLKAKDKLIKAVKAKDEAGIAEAEKEMKDAESAMTEGPGAVEAMGDTHVHIHNDNAAEPNAQAGVNGAGATKMTDEEIAGGFSKLTDSMEKIAKTCDAIAAHVGYKADDSEATKEIEGQLEEEAPAGTGDKARKARDSVFMTDSYQETVALAEILLPGVRVPQFTRDAKPADTLKQICGLRHEALSMLNGTPDGRRMIEEVHGRPLVLDGMSVKDCRTLFRAVGALKKAANRDGVRSSATVTRQAVQTGAHRTTIDIAAQVAAYHAPKSQAGAQ